MSSAKTEQPTAKRLRDARKKGQVFHSKDVSSTALLIAIFATIGFTWHWNLENLQEMILIPSKFYNQPFETACQAVVAEISAKCFLIVLPILGSVIIVGILANILQIGPLVVFEPMKPDFNKLDPIQKLKQMFSFKNLIELFKNILKITFLGVLLYNMIKSALPTLNQTPYGGLPAVLTILTSLLYQLAIFTVIAYAIIAFADFFFQRHQYIKGLMMSKSEVRQEYKEMEGDPAIKSKRRQLHQELLMNNTMERVRQASVLITNPTHLAIAVYYNREKTKLPVIYAKGEGSVAQRMIEIAQKAGVPVMQNIPLAHDLFDHGDINQYIPSELIEPIAEVLRWVQQLKPPTVN